MANDHNPEHGPIEDESSVTRQSLQVAIIRLKEYMTWDYPEAIRGYNDLEEIMTHLEDAYTALDTEALPTGDEDKMWCNFLIPEMAKLNCGHHPQRVYRLDDGDLVAECRRCNYSAIRKEPGDVDY